MAERYARILQAVRSQPWAILPEYLEAMLEVLELRASGARLTPDEIQARLGSQDHDDRPAAVQRVGGVAVLALHGVLVHRANLFTEISGGTSTEVFGRDIDAAVEDPEVQAIAISIASPGGAVGGVEEAALRVYQARQKKPTIAVADVQAASGGYWIGAQAHEFVASPSSEVGSIGIVGEHRDVSEAEKTLGVKTTVLRMPAMKALGHPSEPLTDEVREDFEARMRPFYELFVNAVARGRGVSADDVRAGYGEGRMLAAKPALKAGLVDRIDTLAQVVQRLSTPQGRRALMDRQQASAGAGAAITAQEPPGATAQESPRALARELAAFELDTL